ncbi:P-loop containing nucleoside triphosphate hydrolase protein [Armillaria mellea]|nr:P-loop containing nucleoside triphosphate hydrolase protein [Armillaria mellea]
MPTFNLFFDDIPESDDPELEEILANSRASLEPEEAAPYSGSIQQQEGSIENDKQAGATGHAYYDGSSFPWSKDLRSKMRSIFKIQDFRHCQRSVCNASMDAKDIICVMPTGGGKSLTYQLPALLTGGCTLVISPLVSLISDQLMYLQAAGVNAVKSIALKPDDDQEQTNQRLIAMAKGKLDQKEEDIRLCYATPEKVIKSARFRTILERLAQDNKLTRIVIDEAHCIAEYGNEFRSDYKRLGILRQSFPSVPILALTATCPPRVLQELTSVLGLTQVCNGWASDTTTEGTLYFSSSLYRENLHYRITSKSSKKQEVIKDFTAYILEHHHGESGIIYCLSQKDAESVAKQVFETSGGVITTGVYHASKSVAEKNHLHLQWKRGEIKVVCATTAFGLGIDKGDVRFVIYHSLPQSLDGFYQGSGRAGRDGQDADCILSYRPQDAWKLAAMTMKDPDWSKKLLPLIKFVENTSECRKHLFARHFSHTPELSTDDWSTEGASDLDRCGHCDNCFPDSQSSSERDVTYVSWQLLKFVQTICGPHAEVKVTPKGLASRLKVKHSKALVKSICGGTLDLHKDDIEALLVHLWLEGYLAPQFTQHSYGKTPRIYLQLTLKSSQLLRHSGEQLKNGECGVSINVSFPIRKGLTRKQKINGTRRRNFIVASDSDASESSADNNGDHNNDIHRSYFMDNGDNFGTLEDVYDGGFCGLFGISRKRARDNTEEGLNKRSTVRVKRSYKEVSIIKDSD